MTILNIFCTLMECEVLQKISGAFIAAANFRACVHNISIRILICREWYEYCEVLAVSGSVEIDDAMWDIMEDI